MFELSYLLYIVVGFALGFPLATMFFSSSRRNRDLAGKHVVVTGGSSGIGMEMAKQAAEQGANVTLIARNQGRLREAEEAVNAARASPSKQQVQSISVDISKDPSALATALADVETDLGPVYMLVNCAGSAIAAKFEDTSADDVQRMMDINYFGSVNVTRALMPAMKAREDGIIVFVASQAALIGLFGYTAYAASKYAVRGFAEALEMELRPYGISVTVGFPPDTDTPGYAEENKGKPKETVLLSETAGLFKPEDVAKATISAALSGKFYDSPGMDGWMLTNLCAGMTDSSFLSVIVQFFLLGIMRVVAWGYRQHFNSVVKRCKVQRNKEKRLD